MYGVPEVSIVYRLWSVNMCVCQFSYPSILITSACSHISQRTRTHFSQHPSLLSGLSPLDYEIWSQPSALPASCPSWADFALALPLSSHLPIPSWLTRFLPLSLCDPDNDLLAPLISLTFQNSFTLISLPSSASLTFFLAGDWERTRHWVLWHNIILFFLAVWSLSLSASLSLSLSQGVDWAPVIECDTHFHLISTSAPGFPALTTSALYIPSFIQTAT